MCTESLGTELLTRRTITTVRQDIVTAAFHGMVRILSSSMFCFIVDLQA